MTVVEIRPHRWGWKAFEAPGVEPVFPRKDQAINYAQNRASFRSGEIRILDSSGNVERAIHSATYHRLLAPLNTLPALSKTRISASCERLRNFAFA
jgi:hypothetical protein